MGITNLRHSLEKRYSALTGELQDVRYRVERIKREAERLVALEERIPDLERQIGNARNTLKDVYPEWNEASRVFRRRFYLSHATISMLSMAA